MEHGGVQYSGDGQYWWDGKNWQLAGHEAEHAGQQQGAAAQVKHAQFAFGPDDTFRIEDAHGGEPKPNSAVRAWYAVKNTGGAAGSPVLHLSCPESNMSSEHTWSLHFEPGTGPDPNDCFIETMIELPAGMHTFRLTVQPGDPGRDQLEKTIEIK